MSVSEDTLCPLSRGGGVEEEVWPVCCHEQAD
jgi:hypothetical protein